MWYQAPALTRPGTETTRSPGASGLRSAGWSRTERLDVGTGPFQALRWSNLRTNWAARDQVIKGWLKRDLAGAMRNAWLDQEVPHGSDRRAAARRPLPVVGNGDLSTRVFILGDTGDASEAQFAVARHIVGRAARPGVALETPTVSAILIESDLVYPAGSYDEYDAKFFAPYAGVLAKGIPMYAVPGNHDWNDGSLTGFMAAFCGATQRPLAVDAERRLACGSRWAQAVERLGWHDGSPTGFPAGTSPAAGGAPPQVGPYVALDVAGVLFVGLDTGYDGPLDHEQATWLVQTVDAAPGVPKILFTGKPLVVDGVRHFNPFLPPVGSGDPTVHGEGGFQYRSTDDVVGRPGNGFVAAVGGDVHNYQRYLTRITGELGTHTIPYLVCGGSGVFVGQTFWMPKVAIAEDTPNGHVECDEVDTVLFPTRAHSRLFIDAIMRKSLQRVRFTLFIALAIAGILTIALAAAGALLGGHVGLGDLASARPDVLSGVSLLLIAVAVNTSAHPIARSGRVGVAAFAVLGCAAAALGVERGLGVGSHAAGIAQSRGAIVAFFAVGVVLLLSPGPGHLTRGRAGGCIVGIGALGSLDAAFPAGAQAAWAIAGILVVTVAVLAVASRWAFPRLTVDAAIDEVGSALSAPSLWLRIRRASVGWLAKRQRLLSTLCETFSDGRLTETTNLDVGICGRPYVPLYRSFLEIEYQRDPPGQGWEFRFTAFAVTGEATSDTTDAARPPIIVDAFDVSWNQASGPTVISTPAAG